MAAASQTVYVFDKLVGVEVLSGDLDWPRAVDGRGQPRPLTQLLQDLRRLLRVPPGVRAEPEERRRNLSSVLFSSVTVRTHTVRISSKLYAKTQFGIFDSYNTNTHSSYFWQALPILTACISVKLCQYSQFVFSLQSAGGAVLWVEAVLKVNDRFPDELIGAEGVVVPDLHLQDARHRQRYVKLKPPARPAVRWLVRKRGTWLVRKHSAVIGVNLPENGSWVFNARRTNKALWWVKILA